MYLGKLMEISPAEELYTKPIHPYTSALLSAIPIPDPVENRARTRHVIEGEPPNPIRPPSGCRFHTRCPRATDICRQVEPQLTEYADGHLAACHHPQYVTAEEVAAGKRSETSPLSAGDATARFRRVRRKRSSGASSRPGHVRGRPRQLRHPPATSAPFSRCAIVASQSILDCTCKLNERSDRMSPPVHSTLAIAEARAQEAPPQAVRTRSERVGAPASRRSDAALAILRTCERGSQARTSLVA